MQIETKRKDLEGIEPPKSFRNAEGSVPYDNNINNNLSCLHSKKGPLPRTLSV